MRGIVITVLACAALMLAAADADARGSRSRGGGGGGYSPPSADGCTRASPCVGPRGGVYYYNRNGNKQYIPR